MKNQIDLSSLIVHLPPLISRDHVGELLGGVISSKTLANLDSLGAGPKRMRMGDFLEWLASRTTLLN
jgi:hypothetical protein